MNEIICYLQSKPLTGALGSFLSFILGITTPVDTFDIVSKIISTLLQWGAFSVSIAVGIVTLYAQIEKIRNKQRHKKGHCK
jgi:fructose-specific phosphotransferase system IIC component